MAQSQSSDDVLDTRRHVPPPSVDEGRSLSKGRLLRRAGSVSERDGELVGDFVHRVEPIRHGAHVKLLHVHFCIHAPA
jgi:hypothetical protein